MCQHTVDSPFGGLLYSLIESQINIIAGNSILAAEDLHRCTSYIYLYLTATAKSSQFLIIESFQTVFADDITDAVILTLFRFQFIIGNFRNIAEGMRCQLVVYIFSNGLNLDDNTGEQVLLLLDNGNYLQAHIIFNAYRVYTLSVTDSLLDILSRHIQQLRQPIHHIITYRRIKRQQADSKARTI